MRLTAVLAFATLAPCLISGNELSRQTLKAFQSYVEGADRAMSQRGQTAERVTIPDGAFYEIHPWESGGPKIVAEGLIHDWVGAAFVPKAKASAVVAALQDYDNYSHIYSPDLIWARTLSRTGDRRKVSMRVVKKKVITVVMDMDYDIEYRKYPNGVAQVWSRGDRINEVVDVGKPSEHKKPDDTGYGFLWRLYSYWQIEERDGGVYMECRAISLTRDIPPGLSWIIKPMVTALPRESLVNTLEATRREVERRLR